jgi:DNA-binding XRE family transcriptional regulator
LFCISSAKNIVQQIHPFLQDAQNILHIMVKKVQSPLIPLMSIRGLTQQDVADFLGVSRNTVSNWMTGKIPCRLTLKEWYELAEFLGTTLDKMPTSFGPQPIHKTSTITEAEES